MSRLANSPFSVAGLVRLQPEFLRIRLQQTGTELSNLLQSPARVIVRNDPFTAADYSKDHVPCAVDLLPPQP